ncbi:MAG: leucine-rich repeat domain-containing protein, partial [Candidatus Thorarchaeota archaeon]
MSIEDVDLSQLRGVDLETLSLYSNYIERIDLAPLAKCRRIRVLRLSINCLHSLDLNPLAECSNLNVLDIGPNELETIDLSPLASLSELKVLRVDGNKLRSIDLSPLAGHPNLEFLDLSMNELERIDLWPLASNIGLQKILLVGNRLTSIDISPLVLVGNQLDLQKDMGVEVVIHPDLETRIEESSTDENGLLVPLIEDEVWRNLFQSVMRFCGKFTEAQQIRFQRMFLKLLRMDELGIYDGPLHHILSAIPDDADYLTARSILYDKMMELVGKQLESKGLTLFMDIERLSITRGSRLVPEILKRRKEEIQKLRIPIFNNRANLVPLWMTTYGYAVLKSLEIEASEINHSVLRKIRGVLKEAGFKLRTKKVKDPA